MGCGLSKPQRVSRSSHARLEELNKRARKRARDASLEDHPPNRITRAERHHMASAGGKNHLTAGSSKGPKRKETHDQPKQAAEATTVKGGSASPSDTHGNETKSRRRHGGKKVARRRENQRIREREKAAHRQRDEDLKAAMASIPEQRGSMLGQRVERATMSGQPWRKSTHEKEGTKETGKSVYGAREHKAGSGSGQTRAKIDEKQVPTQAADVSGDEDVVRKPVVLIESIRKDSPIDVPTEPKKDRLAREAASKPAPGGSVTDLFHGAGNSPKDENKSSTLRFKTFESETEPLVKPVRGRHSEERREDDKEHGSDTAKQDVDVIKSPQKADLAELKTEKRLSQSSQIDWISIRERMESKLGKPSSAAPTTMDSSPPQSNTQFMDQAEEIEPQNSVVTSNKNTAGWSFNKASSAASKTPSAPTTTKPEAKENVKRSDPQNTSATAKTDSTGWSFDNVL